MDTFSLTTELRQVAQRLVDDRDNLLATNAYLRSALAAQQLQLRRYEELLTITQGRPTSGTSKKASTGTWITTFLYDPGE